jgi:hypothetical protein
MTEGEPQSEFDVALERTPAPGPTVPAELALIHSLQDLGVDFPDLPSAIRVVENAFDEHGDQRAAECLAIVCSRLKGKGGSILKFALLNACGIASEARACGVSRQSFWHSIRHWRAKLTAPLRIEGHGVPSETTTEERHL